MYLSRTCSVMKLAWYNIEDCNVDSVQSRLVFKTDREHRRLQRQAHVDWHRLGCSHAVLPLGGAYSGEAVPLHEMCWRSPHPFLKRPGGLLFRKWRVVNRRNNPKNLVCAPMGLPSTRVRKFRAVMAAGVVYNSTRLSGFTQSVKSPSVPTPRTSAELWNDGFL